MSQNAIYVETLDSNSCQLERSMEGVSSAGQEAHDHRAETIKFISFLFLNMLVAGGILILITASSIAQNETSNKTEKTSAETKPAFDKPYGYYLNPLLDYIQANSDQRTKITVILQSYRGKIEPLRNDYNSKRQEFLDNVVKGVSSDTIMSQEIKMGHLYQEINSHYCQMSLEVRRVLNPDQIVRYEEFKRQRGWSKSK